jgi:NAD(P)-dependent dehydrogenase (short-subunit alcohol dehydrogenase family)
MSSLDYDGRVVWITGASSGIGRAVARQLADQGADLVLSSRREEKLQSLASECADVRTTVLPLDVTERPSVEAATDTIEDKYGRLDVAFFNAGTYGDMPEALDPDTIEKDFDVNFFGIVYCLNAALPLLRESAVGRAVAMSSATAYGPLPRASSYGASKAAVKYLVEALRFEWGVKDVDVDLSVVCPGFVETPMTEQNDFPMPFMVDVEEAADIITRGIARGKKEISFPWPLILPLKLVNQLPAFLYDRLIPYITGMA